MWIKARCDWDEISVTVYPMEPAFSMNIIIISIRRKQFTESDACSCSVCARLKYIRLDSWDRINRVGGSGADMSAEHFVVSLRSQLIALTYCHVIPNYKLAEWAGIAPQSLSRFRDSREHGGGRRGLETPVLERLWKVLDLHITLPQADELCEREHGDQLQAIKLDQEAGIISDLEAAKRMRSVFAKWIDKYKFLNRSKPMSLCDQLRCVIDTSGIRPGRVARETGVSPSILSLFLAGRRGLSMTNIERLWDYFNLELVPGSSGTLPPELRRYIPPLTYPPPRQATIGDSATETGRGAQTDHQGTGLGGFET